MGLTTDIQTDIALAFDTDLADAVSNLVLEHNEKSTGSYSISDGSYTGSLTEATSRGVFGSYEQSELYNSAIEPTDVKLIILQNEISIEPKNKDTIIKENSKSFRVIAVGMDPAKATYVLQVRSIES